MLKSYYELTKPGIIYGNVLTAAAGFLFASHWHVVLSLFLATLGGTSLVIASACVCNNYLDRGIDKHMARTKKRALVQGDIPGNRALVYAAVLGVVGFGVLIMWTNTLVVAIGLVAFIDYVALYGWSKRASIYGTLVGSISGAAPIVAGYVAVTNRLDLAALLLFLILVCWQMPHFYAIAMYRLNDYKAAKIPVWPIIKGMRSAKVHILLYISGFVVANALLTVLGYVGYSYLVGLGFVGIIWFVRGIRGFSTANDTSWGRRQFLFSLVVIMALSVGLAIGPLLP